MTIGERIRGRRLEFPEFRDSHSQLAKVLGVRRETVSDWERDAAAPRGANLVALARALQVTPAWILGEDEPSAVGGHGVVRETGEISYDPRPDSEASPAEQLIAFLGVRVGMRRLAGELTAKDLVAAAYTLARAERFSAEEFKKLDAWRDQILADEERRRS